MISDFSCCTNRSSAERRPKLGGWLPQQFRWPFEVVGKAEWGLVRCKSSSGEVGDQASRSKQLDRWKRRERPKHSKTNSKTHLERLQDFAPSRWRCTASKWFRQREVEVGWPKLFAVESTRNRPVVVKLQTWIEGVMYLGISNTRQEWHNIRR